MRQLRRSKKHVLWLICGLVTGGLTAWFTYKFYPDNAFNITLFFCLLEGTILSLTYYLLNNVRRSIFIGFGIGIWLLLRLLGLHQLLYLILIVACLLSLDLLFSKK